MKMEFGKSENNNQGSVYRQWMITILVNITIMTYGLQMGWVSPMIKVLKSDSSPTGTPLTDSEISILAGGICLFAAVGVPIYSYITDAFGRKVGLIALVIPQFVSWVLILVAPNVEILILARTVCGLAAGGCFNVIPIYVKEIAQDDIRGLLGSLMTASQNVGVFCMFAFGAWFDYSTVVWMVIWIPLASLPFLLRAPESPAFLVKVGKVEEATKVLAYLRGYQADHPIVKKEIEMMEGQQLHYTTMPNMTIKTIFQEKAWRRGFILMMCIMSAHAMNGCVVIMQYAVSLLASSGMSVGPEIQSLSLPLVMVLASTITMSGVERFGRKPILFLTWTVGAVCLFSIATIVLLQEKGYSVSGWWTIIAMIGTVAAYAGGVSPIPYVIMSEMFNFQIRAKFMGYIITYTWFLCYLQVVIFEAVSNSFGQYTVFYMHAAVNLSGVFITMALPETKGKAVEQIEDQLRKT